MDVAISYPTKKIRDKMRAKIASKARYGEFNSPVKEVHTTVQQWCNRGMRKLMGGNLMKVSPAIMQNFTPESKPTPEPESDEKVCAERLKIFAKFHKPKGQVDATTKGVSDFNLESCLKKTDPPKTLDMCEYRELVPTRNR